MYVATVVAAVCMRVCSRNVINAEQFMPSGVNLLAAKLSYDWFRVTRTCKLMCVSAFGLSNNKNINIKIYSLQCRNCSRDRDHALFRNTRHKTMASHGRPVYKILSI